MDKELEEVEREFGRVSNLLRVKAFVKHLKKENLNAEVLHMLATTYTTIERAKEIAKDINQLNSRRALTAGEHNQLYLFEDILRDLLKEIRTANEKLESETNLPLRSCVLLSVIDDLDEATRVFKEIVAFGQRLNAL
ncbi:hypothetical protein JTE90_002137 [Oedothorax gibbosus]|uniref:DUF47 family protein n=1 Tax=Oedothorax gibbosus TaxID=931172 RepID=A0AAV6V9K8_9ARAC|nr:hypothetical protein JTE90_002137 [Oedothorax gibbosus]